MDFQLEESDRLLQQTARELAVREFAGDSFSYARTGEYPRRSMKVLAEHGMMGMTVAEPHGGDNRFSEAPGDGGGLAGMSTAATWCRWGTWAPSA